MFLKMFFLIFVGLFSRLLSLPLLQWRRPRRPARLLALNLRLRIPLTLLSISTSTKLLSFSSFSPTRAHVAIMAIRTTATQSRCVERSSKSSPTPTLLPPPPPPNTLTKRSNPWMAVAPFRQARSTATATARNTEAAMPTPILPQGRRQPEGSSPSSEARSAMARRS